MAATPKKGAAKRVSKTATRAVAPEIVEHVGIDGHVHQGSDDGCGLCEALNEPPVQVNPPELYVEKEKPPTPVVPKPKSAFESVYPEGTKLFWYYPKAEGADPIPLPTVVFNQPDKVFFFELHQVRRNPFTQMYMWMDRFEIPVNLQRHIVNIVGDQEFFDMCDKWMESVGGGATSGE